MAWGWIHTDEQPNGPVLPATLRQYTSFNRTAPSAWPREDYLIIQEGRCCGIKKEAGKTLAGPTQSHRFSDTILGKRSSTKSNHLNRLVTTSVTQTYPPTTTATAHAAIRFCRLTHAGKKPRQATTPKHRTARVNLNKHALRVRGVKPNYAANAANSTTECPKTCARLRIWMDDPRTLQIKFTGMRRVPKE